MLDLSLPGYHYLGPGNNLFKGAPTSYNDWVAYMHDVRYGEIVKLGQNPYLLWSEADAQAYQQFAHSDYGGTLGKSFFGLKKLAHDFGLISKVTGEPIIPDHSYQPGVSFIILLFDAQVSSAISRETTSYRRR